MMNRYRKTGMVLLLTGSLLAGAVTPAFADNSASGAQTADGQVSFQAPSAENTAAAETAAAAGSDNGSSSRTITAGAGETVADMGGPGASGSASQSGTIVAGSGQASGETVSSGETASSGETSGETAGTAQPGAATETGSTDPAQSGQPLVPVGTGELTESQGAELEAEQAAAEAEASQLNNPLVVPQREPRLQTTVLTLAIQNWSTPFVNDQDITTDGTGFSGISTFMENIHGDLLYRTYSSANGWSEWVLNGQQTGHVSTMVPVEAIQYRFKGPVADSFDLYYTTTLSDGTQTGWAKNGQTAGTMGQGLYITGYRLAFFRKGTEATVDTANPLKAAHADGVQVVDGVLRYIHGDGSNYTGWGWVENDQYYFQDSYPVTGWQYIDGYKYYFAEDGKLVTDVESLLPAGGPYMLKINKEMNCLTVYAKDGDNGFIIPVKAFLTSVGDDTPIGTFKTPEKYRWRLMIHDLYTQYATRLSPGMPILMHSIIYDRPDPFSVWASTYNNLGIARSAGCIRLATIDSKWIYDNCAIGTTVTVYNSSKPGPFERPTIMYEIPFEQTWDPTDPNVTPEMIAAETQRIIDKFNP